MKYYLIKSVNNIPFIFGQFDSKEEAIKALEDTPKNPLVSYEVVSNIEENERLQQELDNNTILIEKARGHSKYMIMVKDDLLMKVNNRDKIILELQKRIEELTQANSYLRVQLDKHKSQIACQLQKLMDSI